jgi:hypothetical protein
MDVYSLQFTVHSFGSPSRVRYSVASNCKL